MFEVEELEYKEGNDILLARDLASDCDVTISMTCLIHSYTNDTRSILVSILPYSRSRNSKIRKLYTDLTHGIKSDYDMVISVTW